MPNDNVRLAIHGSLFAVILICATILIAMGRITADDGIQLITVGAGLIASGLATAKLLQDRRGGSDGDQQ